MIGLLGGTFDPVHFGHLRIALELQQSLALDEVRFIPCHVPPHREMPLASPRQRTDMLAAAIAGSENLRIDTRELERSGPSYSIDTLAELRAELGGMPLCLIIGTDALLGLDTWHRWQALTDYAHIIVAQRPGAQLHASGALGDWLAPRLASQVEQLRAQPAGRVLPWQVTALDISATRIRADLAAGRNVRFLLPDAVLALIHRQGLYGVADVATPADPGITVSRG